MNKVKSTNTVILRKVCKDKKLLERVKSRLSAKALKIFNKPKMDILIPQHIEEEILLAGALILFPNSGQKIWDLGQLLAEKSMNTIYRLFLKVSSPTTAIKRADQMWHAFFNKGKLFFVNQTDKSATMVVAGFPELKPYQIELTNGYMVVILEYAGAKNVAVKFNPSDPNSWKWHVKWD
ncbi:MAG: hypothetical protein JW871_05695 [Endomicrobiales bacterium]|nr:hypothetical protein [Endomicrobiales bacterium]